MNRRQLITATVAAAVLAMPGLAGAQNAWPTQPIKLIVPYPAGGGTDFFATTTCPDARLSHTWIEREGRALSTPDLVLRDGFVLVTGRRESPGANAVQDLAQRFGVRIDIACIHDDGPLQDVCHSWRNVREIGDDGALLVRPDQVIVWRSLGAQARPEQELEAALRLITRTSAPTAAVAT